MREKYYEMKISLFNEKKYKQIFLLIKKKEFILIRNLEHFPKIFDIQQIPSHEKIINFSFN